MELPVSSLPPLLRRLARERPDDLAYLFLADGEAEADRLTYGELDRQARGIGAALQRRELNGERALLIYPPGLEFVSAFLGCLYAGCVAVPAYPPRSARSLPRLQAIAEDARPRAVLTTASLLARTEPLLGSLPALRAAAPIATDELGSRAAEWVDPEVSGAALAFIQYTSGSTATPKGVMVSHANLLHNEALIRQAFAQSSDSVILGWLPLFHDMGLIGNVLQPLYVGARCVLMSPVAFLQRPLRWLEAIGRYRATTSGGPNFAYDLCVRKIGPEQRTALDLGSWKVAFNGAEPVRAETLERFAAAFAPCGFRREAFFPCYGLAEATLFATGGSAGRAPVVRAFAAAPLERRRVEPAPAGPAAAAPVRELVGCGRPWLDQQVVIVDPESRRRAAADQVGEIWIAGPSVAQGYWGRPEVTASEFRACLAGEPEAGPFLRTGDLGFLADGELFVTGRLKDLVIIRGRNHYPQDLETSAERAHPALRPGCGAAFAVDVAGEERLVIAQEVRREAGGSVGESPDEVLEAVNRAVAEEHEIQPWDVVLLRTGTIAKTSSGKIRRHACRAAYLAGGLEVVARSRPDGTAQEAAGRDPAPAGESSATPPGLAAADLAARLRDGAARLLRRAPDELPLDRPLTALGLDSLSAAELAQEIEQRLGVGLDPAALLDGATLESLAGEILARLAGPLGAAPASAPAGAAGEEGEAAGGEAGDLALSYQQKALWFLQRLAPASAAYHITAAASIEGDLDAAALQHCFAALAQRHPALRTTFADRGGAPAARVHRRLAPDFATIDLEGVGASGGEALAALLVRAAHRPFDLERGPLLRVALFRRAARQHVMVLAVHHLVADFRSLAILLAELAELYPHQEAAASRLPALTADYAAFVHWQRQRLAAAGERLWSYWRNTLHGPLPDLDLPTDRLRPAVQSDRGASVALAFGPELAGQLRLLSVSSGATLFMSLLAGFQALLQRYANQDDLLVGTPVSGRGAKAAADLVGCFINPLVLRTDAAGDPSFGELLGRVRRVALGAFAHQDLPFALLTERLQPARDPSRSPLFQVMLTLYRAQGPEQQPLAGFALGEAGAEMRLGPLLLRSVALPARPAQLDLNLTVAETERGLDASLRYAADLFDQATAARMAGHLRTLLAAAAADPAQPVGCLPLLGPAERGELLAGWNATAAPYPQDRLLHELFEAQVDRTPQACAVETAAERLTYQELDHRANRLAHHLVRLGIGPEVTVGIHAERSAGLVIALLGVLKAGGAYLPLDPSYPAERLAHMLADSGAPLVLTQGRSPSALAGFGGRLLRLDEDGPAFAAESAARPRRRSDPANRAYLIYTSGSTGRPKGVELHHRGVVNFLGSMAREPGLAAADSLLSVTTLSFDIAGLEIFLPLAVGARVIMADRETAADAGRLLAALGASGATVMQATPSTWRLLLAAGWQGQPRLQALCGGEALPPDLADQLARRAGSAWNLYGPTETTIWSAVSRLLPRASAADPVLIGRPIANTRIYLVDRRLQMVPAAVPGELLIGGDGLARGYFGRPELTAERFVPDPFGAEPGGRLYRTGDLARRRAGGLEVLGRLDHQVKVRGFRVELGEVEAALAAWPGVRQAVVVARPDPAGSQRLVAYLALAGGGRAGAPRAGEPPRAAGELEVGALRRFLGERLPEAFIPTRFVALPELPLTPNGKVDRGALPQPDAGRPDLAAEYQAPRSALERTVAAVWREALGVAEVGIHDNFFDLGGHSLLLAQVQSRLAAALGRELPLVDLFRHPTVGALALHLSRDGEEKTAAASGTVPAQLAAAAPVAVIGMAGRFPGARDVDELWRRVRDGEELISRFGDEELAAEGIGPSLLADPAYVKAAGILAGAELFAAPFFGFSPRDAALMDPQHRVFLECAWQALEDAGYDGQRYPGRIGVYAGVGINTYLHYLRHAWPSLASETERYQAFIANDKDFVPTRVSYKLGLTGPSVNVQTACSSSLVALHLACQALRAGDCDLALVGAVSIRVPQRVGYLWEEGGILSPDGRCRAFDAGAQGTVFGSGAGIVVLRPLERALADGDTIYAVVKGSAINNDGGRKVGYTAPSVEGQAAVIAAALAAAGVPPATIGYVEAHGTGTPMGDPIEVAALNEAFAGHGGRCALGSVKTNLGHLDTASGMAGLIKAVQALRHRALPPSLHCARPNPRIDFAAGPFHVNTSLADWPAGPAPRRAGVSSFGIGGTNAHVVLEEAPEPAAGSASRPWQLLVLSAKTPAALEEATDNLAGALREPAQPSLADLAHTLQVGRSVFAERRVLVCSEPGEAAAALAARDPERVVSVRCEPGQRPVAFLFSGQGTQYVDMGRGLYELEPTFRREVDACCELLAPHLGLDLRRILYPDGDSAAGRDEAERQLAQTSLAQPALFVVEHALARLWMEWGVVPQAMIGHSVGEYVAACLAGVMALPDALALVAARGRLMQELPGGAMLGVPLAEAETVALLAGADGLALAAVNGPASCVVSGPAAAVAELAERLEREGVRCRRLRTSHAFHSPMMEPILARFAAAVGEVRLRPPRIPFVSNLTGAWITAAEAQDPAYWCRHLRAPVRFADGVGRLLAEPGRVLLEAGPGNALAALVRQQDARRLVAGSLRHPHDRQPDAAFLLRSLGRLWLAGVEPDWSGFYAHETRRRIPLPAYPFERQPYWLEPRPLAAAPAAAGAGKLPDLADWFHVPLWRQSVPRARPAAGSGDGPWLLLLEAAGGGPRVLERLAERLEAWGEEVAVARIGERFAAAGKDAFTVDPRRGEDWDALLAALAAAGRLPRRIVHAWNVDAAAPGRAPRAGRAADPAAGAEAQMRGFDSLVLLAQALERAASGAPVRIVVLSNNLHRVAGETVLCPQKALLLGAVRVIPQEIAGLSCQSVDLLLPEAADADAPSSLSGRAGGGAEAAELELADALLAELAGPAAAEPVVALRGTARFVRSFGALRLPAHLPEGADGADGAGATPAGGVVLITGGLGGLGLAFAEELAGRPGAKLALLGRSRLPPRADFADWLATHGDGDEMSARIRRVQALEARGAEVLALAADVTDEAALAAALSEVEERLGPIRGVIHAAGVPGGGSLRLKTPEAAARVLAPKVRGTLLLDELLGGRELDFFLLCSSLTALLGGFGQSDYCAANAFCDAFAQARQRPGTLVAAIAWDRWEEVGMAARTPSPLAALGRGGNSGRRPAHPLFDACLSESPGRDVYVSRLSAERHWVLAEHRIAGKPTVPGTAYLEMARAAAAARLPAGAVELRGVVFPAPLALAEGESREVRTIVEGNGGSLAFRVISRPAAPEGAGALWLEHARGTIGAAAGPPPARAALAELRASCGARQLVAGALTSGDLGGQPGGEPGSEPDGESGGFLLRGPRWQSLRKVYLGDGESLAKLELGAEFSGDLDDYQLHPALLDVAAGAVQLLGRGNYLPLAYDRLTAHAPLPRKAYSHFRQRSPAAWGAAAGAASAPPAGGGDDLLTCDITVFDEQGAPLVEIEGFTMKRVGAEALAQLRRAGSASAGRTLAALGLAAPRGEESPVAPAAGEGILPREGVEAFRRILRQRGLAQIAVSTRDLGTALAQAEALTAERLAAALGELATPASAHPRPAVSSVFAAPAGDFERRVAAVWERVLGIERVGVHDNFFELGGTSLSAIQLTGELRRELGVEIPTIAVFQAPTVGALARHLQPGGGQPSVVARSQGRAEKKKQALELARRTALQVSR